MCKVFFSPDAKLVAATGVQGPPVLFEVENGKELDSFGKEFDLGANSWGGDSPLAFSPNGKALATLGGRAVLHFWDLTTGTDLLATPEAHLGGVSAFAFLADGKTLVSGSDDNTIRFWDLATGRTTKTLSHDSWVRSIAVSADGLFLAAGLAYPARAVQLWNLKSGERLHTWPVAHATLRTLTLSEDGSSVIIVLADGFHLRWDLLTRKGLAIGQPDPKKALELEAIQLPARTIMPSSREIAKAR